MNNNTEGYIESNPAIIAPGGLAVAGYTNCHMFPVPYSFECLGGVPEVTESVERFVEILFAPNDIPNLQKGGNLRAVILSLILQLLVLLVL